MLSCAGQPLLHFTGSRYCCNCKIATNTTRTTCHHTLQTTNKYRDIHIDSCIRQHKQLTRTAARLDSYFIDIMGKRRCGNKNSKRHHRKSKAESTNPTRLDLCDANDDDIQEDKNGVLEYQEDRSLIIRAASLTPVSSPLSICLPNIVLQNPIDRSISKVSYSKNTSSRKKIVRRLTFYAAIAALLLLLFGSVTKIQGVRRTWKFWKLVFPVVLDYKLELWHLHFWKGIRDDDALSKALMPFHERNAPRVYRIVIEMGGMFIKVGQIIGTVGIGIVPDPYVMALRHLQNGVEPRTYEEIAAIIEHSTGQKMEDLFEVFHPQPLGAASIAQAHKAVIKQNNETVVIKVQYPDVAESFYVDFTNVELFTLIVNPEDMEFIQSVRRNHERELDFTVEAQNLREVQLNLQRHGVEPSLVRIPNVRNETGICSPTILALEFLPGISLKSAIDDEQHRMALGLGMQNVQDLRQSIAMRMREQHYHADRTPEQQAAFSVRQAKMLQQFGPALAGILRVVGAIKEWWGERVMGNDHMAVTSSLMKQQQQQHVNLGRALKTMVHVHGLQLLKDGVMNMDPHPGNSAFHSSIFLYCSIFVKLTYQFPFCMCWKYSFDNA